MEFLKAAFMPFVYMIIGILVASVAAAISPQAYEAHPMMWTLIAALIMIPFCLLQMKKEGYFEGETLEKGGFKDWVLLGILASSSCVALNYWIEMSGLMELFPGFGEVSERLYGGSLLEEVLAIAIAAPLVEELMFRGLVYKGWKKVLGGKLAIVFAALFFGVYHRNVVQGLYAFLLGLLLIYVYELFETILAPILFHMAANTVSVFMTECLDMSWVKQSWGIELAFTMIFTLLGFGAWLLLKRSSRLHRQEST